MALTSRCAFGECTFAITLSDDTTIKEANSMMNEHWVMKHMQDQKPKDNFEWRLQWL